MPQKPKHQKDRPAMSLITHIAWVHIFRFKVEFSQINQNLSTGTMQIANLNDVELDSPDRSGPPRSRSGVSTSHSWDRWICEKFVRYLWDICEIFVRSKQMRRLKETNWSWVRTLRDELEIFYPEFVAFPTKKTDIFLFWWGKNPKLVLHTIAT